MNQLETILEEKISGNIQTVLKTHIETEVGKVKQELKEENIYFGYTEMLYSYKSSHYAHYIANIVFQILLLICYKSTW
jgi:hypothetical protein